MKPKVVLIGGAGYIGNACIDFFLKKNLQILCIDNLIYKQNKPKKKKNFKFIKLDISENKKILKKINNDDTVIYLAGLVGDPITDKYKRASKKINEKNTIKLLDSLLKLKIKHVVFVSTCSNYGITKKKRAVNEESALNPVSLYAKSKIKVENFLKKKSKNYSEKITILRFATAFGFSSRMRFDLTVNQFVMEILTKGKIEIYDADTWRPYCHVKDFANAIYRVINIRRNNLFEIYNIGSNKNNYTKRMLIKKISKYIKTDKVNFVNKSKDYRNYKVDFNKMKKELNFEPKYSIEYGIIEIKNFLKKTLKGIKLNNFNSFGNHNI